MQVIVSERNRQEMQLNGYTIFEDVFTLDEMAVLEEVLEEFFEGHRQRIAAAGGTEGISREMEILFTDHIAEKDLGVASFVRRHEFVKLSTEFLGPDTVLYWNQTVYKMPEADKIFPWHQDDGYTPVDPSPYLTLWLAINDATVQNGCISVLPGSHKNGLQPHEETPIGLVCYPASARDQGVPVPLRAGSIAAFWSLTMHKSGPNLTSGTRKAYVIQYAPFGLRVAGSPDPIPGLMRVARGGKPWLAGRRRSD